MPDVELIYQVREVAQWDVMGSGKGGGVDTEFHNLERLLMSFNL